MNAVEIREKDHKKIKDIIDIWALIWYSEETLVQLSQNIVELISKEKIMKILESFQNEDYIEASKALQVDKDTIINVINNFITTIRE